MMTDKTAPQRRPAATAGRLCAYALCGNELVGKRQEERFCSRPCAINFRSEIDRSVERVCLRDSCEELVTSHKADYCTAACSKLQRKENRDKQRAGNVCRNKVCGKDISDKHGNAVYCSLDCKVFDNKEATNAAVRKSRMKRRSEDGESLRKQAKAWRDANPEKMILFARRSVYKKHGITLEDYEALVTACDDLCHVCGQAESAPSNRRVGTDERKNKRVLAVDHDHTRTKEDPLYLRGLACYRCNLRLFALDNEVWRSSAEAYLAKSPLIFPAPQSQEKPPRRLREFGLSIDQYEWMLKITGDRCEICLNPETATFRGNPRPLAIDHVPGTPRDAPGVIRGLLCGICNTRLSALENKIWRPLGEAYLERHAEWERTGQSWKVLLKSATDSGATLDAEDL